MLFYGPQLGGWGWLPGLSFLVFWALLAVIIFALARSFTRSGRRPFGPARATPARPARSTDRGAPALTGPSLH